MRFGHRCGFRGVGFMIVECVRRIPIETRTGLHRQRHVRQLVLDRLKAADRFAELGPRLHVVQAHVQRPPHHAKQFRARDYQSIVRRGCNGAGGDLR